MNPFPADDAQWKILRAEAELVRGGRVSPSQALRRAVTELGPVFCSSEAFCHGAAVIADLPADLGAAQAAYRKFCTTHGWATAPEWEFILRVLSPTRPEQLHADFGHVLDWGWVWREGSMWITVVVPEYHDGDLHPGWSTVWKTIRFLEEHLPVTVIGVDFDLVDFPEINERTHDLADFPPVATLLRDGRFPQPLAYVRGRRVWAWTQINSWLLASTVWRKWADDVRLLTVEQMRILDGLLVSRGGGHVHEQVFVDSPRTGGEANPEWENTVTTVRRPRSPRRGWTRRYPSPH